MDSGYDMMGLEDMGAWMTADQLKGALMGAAVGAVGITVVSTALSKIDQPAAVTDPTTWVRIKDGLAVLTGVLGGRVIYGDGMSMQRRDAAMSFVGGVAGMGLAHLMGTFMPVDSGVRYSLGGGHLSGAELRALEAAVATTSPAWHPSGDGMQGTTVRSSQLQAPVVTDVDLGALGNYMPYLS